MHHFILPSNSQKRTPTSRPPSEAPDTPKPDTIGHVPVASPLISKDIPKRQHDTTPIPIRFTVPSDRSANEVVSPTPDRTSWATPGFKIPGDESGLVQERRRSRKGLLGGGYADRLSSLVFRDKSDAIMWLHMLKRRDQYILHPTSRLRVLRTWKTPGLAVLWCECTILDQSNLPSVDSGEVCFVGFRHCVELYSLSGGHTGAVKAQDLVDVYEAFDNMQCTGTEDGQGVLRGKRLFLCTRYIIIDEQCLYPV
ncbi:uncharacterized protein SPPG_01939 [Spizellomyces punctatus DAOM BR117]|uniref:Uncharacterized protein n=1 Tax=Spizellomyces punctatus (strain DAOM BR117) TaxID=645134 RepID=A0A0L0HPX0_SPIPD|nr:uncharacterized protein SPPG_01939 [Spizellomyces punctatus DAOM BR117]KND02859.1 hypothetical protein SPPG_01939 [Spizellomyces punctatus DAOM BR117]|eukprot:XP_016610898.1 hypothetical protein SPPG_01939 [Spizellomyces punctatus DAOM BR117]